MILGIIPARGGSEMVDKNIRPLCGKPMIEYTIEAAENSVIDDWFVFTDKYFQYQTLGIHRPPEYSKGEHGSVVKWLPYAICEYERTQGVSVDYICLLQPTSPLRTAEDINRAVELISGHSLVSGYYMRIKSDDVDHKTIKNHFQRNGAIFLFDRHMVMKGKLWDENTVKMIMPKQRSIDIDTEEDFYIAECVIRHPK